MILDPVIRDQILKQLDNIVETLRPIVMGQESARLEWIYVTLRGVLKKLRYSD